jgi:hypothetical protein
MTDQTRVMFDARMGQGPSPFPASGRLTLRGPGAPARELGRCRHPVPGDRVGYLVNRVGAVTCATQLEDPRVVGDIIDEEGDGFAGAPWALGDVVDVHPMTTPATRCGRCLPCRVSAAYRFAHGSFGRLVGRWVKRDAATGG